MCHYYLAIGANYSAVMSRILQCWLTLSPRRAYIYALIEPTVDRDGHIYMLNDGLTYYVN